MNSELFPIKKPVTDVTSITGFLCGIISELEKYVYLTGKVRTQSSSRRWIDEYQNRDEFDYQAYMKDNAPDLTQVIRGPKARQQRRELAKTRITIRIDEDTVKKFKQMVPDGRGYQSLINQALREWLAAQGVKELLQEELPSILEQAMSSVQ